MFLFDDDLIQSTVQIHYQFKAQFLNKVKKVPNQSLLLFVIQTCINQFDLNQQVKSVFLQKHNLCQGWAKRIFFVLFVIRFKRIDIFKNE